MVYSANKRAVRARCQNNRHRHLLMGLQTSHPVQPWFGNHSAITAGMARHILVLTERPSIRPWFHNYWHPNNATTTTCSFFFFSLVTGQSIRAAHDEIITRRVIPYNQSGSDVTTIVTMCRDRISSHSEYTAAATSQEPAPRGTIAGTKTSLNRDY